MVQWLRLQAPKAGTQVQSLGGELRSHMPHSVAKKYIKNKNMVSAVGFPTHKEKSQSQIKKTGDLTASSMWKNSVSLNEMSK